MACLALLLSVGHAQTASQLTVPQLKNGKIIGAGFVVTLPPGITAEIGGSSESNHGFYIELPLRTDEVEVHSAHTRSYRYIAFDTKWDIGDMPSLDSAVNAITANLADNIPADIVHSGEVTLDGNFPARLGTLPARRLIIKFRNSERKNAIRQVIVAYNARKDASAIVYVLVLNTTEDNFQEDMTVFGKVLAGFKLTGQ